MGVTTGLLKLFSFLAKDLNTMIKACAYSQGNYTTIDIHKDVIDSHSYPCRHRATDCEGGPAGLPGWPARAGDCGTHPSGRDPERYSGVLWIRFVCFLEALK